MILTVSSREVVSFMTGSTIVIDVKRSTKK